MGSAALALLGLLPPGARADVEDLKGRWAGVCHDGPQASEVAGEICFRGEGEARAVSLWGGAFRSLFHINAVEEPRGGERTFEVTAFRWDEGTRTLRFDRQRVVWRQASEPATVVHRIQELRLEGADGMWERATERSTRAEEKLPATGFTCTLRRKSREIAGGCPNCCPAAPRPAGPGPAAPRPGRP